MKHSSIRVESCGVYSFVVELKGSGSVPNLSPLLGYASSVS